MSRGGDGCVGFVRAAVGILADGFPVAGSMLSSVGLPVHSPAIQCRAFMRSFP